jgi:peptidoglycan/xylan/chitin deacetylase (PgdA/CDA1 family)
MTGGRTSAILAYHSLDDSGSPISVPPSVFRRHVESLARSGRPVVPLAEIQRRPGAVAITFDDGFRSFYEHAFPCLREFRLPSTVFVVSGYCGRRNDWPSQPAGIPSFELMGWGELKEIARHGVELGVHTVNHPRMTDIAAEEVDREILGCREDLAQRIGRPVGAFAYPYGLSNTRVREAVKRHFALACGVELDYVEATSDPADLPRLDCYYLRQPFWFDRLTTPLGAVYVSARRRLRRLRRTLKG